jgi:hypothetical protein
MQGDKLALGSRQIGSQDSLGFPVFGCLGFNLAPQFIDQDLLSRGGFRHLREKEKEREREGPR